MPKLTDTQSFILSRASQRDDRIALPLPERLRGAAAQKVVSPLIKRGLLAEVDTDPRKRAALWRQRQDGSFATLAVTDAGLEAIGVEIDPPRPAPERPAQRKGTKQAMLIEMLRAKDGATLDEIVEATGWRNHTARAVISGQLKKRLGLNVVAEVDPRRGRVYRIAD
ncbi:MAG: DUF3489 domain-containing protein [Paracoccaceae bacterium]